MAEYLNHFHKIVSEVGSRTGGLGDFLEAVYTFRWKCL